MNETIHGAKQRHSRRQDGVRTLFSAGAVGCKRCRGRYFNWKGLLQVYLLENTVNGKYYVGKTVSQNLHRYLLTKQSQARRNNPSNMPVVSAIRKYGWAAFRAEVLGIVQTHEELNNLEKLWIILLDAQNKHVGYNVAAGGSGGRVGPCSLETRLKIGQANKGRKPVGYARTAEHSQQLRDRMQGNKLGIKFTTESATVAILNESAERRVRRAAGIKASWDKLTPEQRAARVEKMQSPRRISASSR